MSAGSVWRSIGLASLAACLLAGCGGDKGYDVSGKVTFNGKPVPAGKIYFIPDGSKGNSGATGYANIQDGQYNTASDGGKPAAGGAMIVNIEGLDPSAQSSAGAGDTSGEVTVKTLFPTYKTTADLPKETTTKDFEVPAEAAQARSQPETPMIVP